MTAIRREYNPDVLSNKIIASKLSDKELLKLGIRKDPKGKGLSLMTWRRLKKGDNCKLEVLTLACYSLGITPESTFRKVEDCKLKS